MTANLNPHFCTMACWESHATAEDREVAQAECSPWPEEVVEITVSRVARETVYGTAYSWTSSVGFSNEVLDHLLDTLERYYRGKTVMVMDA